MKIKKMTSILAVTTLFFTISPSMIKADESLERRKSTIIEDSMKQAFFSQIDLSTVKDRQIIIMTKGNLKVLTKKLGITLVKSPDVLSEKGIYIVRVPAAQDYSVALNKLKNERDIISAEPNYEKERTGFINPNDEYYSYQWHHQTIGTPALWEHVDPKNEVVVAVVDTGVDYNHPDLNGQVLNGIDTFDNDNDAMDTVGHGTAVAGTIAAKANNSIGVVGVNPYVKILPIRVGGEKGTYTSDSVEGIYHAIDQGADVINLSYGAYESSKIEAEAVLKAYEKGIVVVAASGNDKKKVTYPAAYPTVLSVGSTNKDNKISSFSNYGETLDLVAPGEEIATTGTNGKYVTASGTSFSSPVVAGIASYMLSVEPKLGPIGVEYLLQKGAFYLAMSPNKWSTSAGYGRLDAVKTFSTDFPSLKSDVGNTRSKAKSISINKTYKDKYDLPGDSDWYKFKVTKNTKVRVDISGVANINQAVWFDKYSSGKVAFEKHYNNAKIGSKESFTYSLKPGTYYLEVYERNNHWSTSSYSLKVTRLSSK